MIKITKGKLRVINDGTLSFWCKGCNKYHNLYIDPAKGIYWVFNGNYESPTFRPSISINDGKNKICHCFITDGRIQYLDDCSHELKGKIIELEQPL